MKGAETPTQRVERLAAEWSILVGGPVGTAACGCPNNTIGMPPALHICRTCGFEGGEAVHMNCPGCRPIPVAIKREFADEVSALAALVDEGLLVMTHDPDWCDCDGTRRLTVACVMATAGPLQLNGQQMR